MSGGTASHAGCPCGGSVYAACCGRFIEGGDIAQTAAELMRSRYTAYVMRNEAYLKATWHATTRPAEAVTRDDDSGGADADHTKWLGLEVRKQTQNGDDATVEFVARYKTGGRAHRLHEVSRFVREGARWYYVDGVFPERKK